MPEIISQEVRTRSMRPGGHYRAGRRHSTEFTAWPPKSVSRAELDQMLADPGLVVELVDAQPEEGDGDKPKNTTKKSK